MPSIADCPSCGGKLRVPEEFLGRKVKCPRCATVFEATGGSSPAPLPPPPAEQEAPPFNPTAPPEPGPPPPPPAEDERPWEQPYRSRVRRDGEPHRGTMILVFGILSLVIGFIGLPFGIAAWVMGSRDLQKMRANLMDPEGMGLTQAGWICGIIGTILQGLTLLCCVGYIFFIAALAAAGA